MQPFTGLRTERTPRFTHLLKPNHNAGVPASRVYVDTEALIDCPDPLTQRQTLWFGWACRERVTTYRGQERRSEEWTRFETAESFFLWVAGWTRPRTATYVYAHNLQYDAALLKLATMAERYDWQVTAYVTSNHLMWVKLRQGNRTLCFVDTLNYFASSLDALGKGIGAYKTVLETLPATVETWSDYCRQDVQVLVNAMRAYFAFIHDHDFGAYQKTAASQAMHAWRHRFMQHEVLIIDDERLSRLERDAYHGGRAEVFYDLPVIEPLACLDVNSLYPYVMASELYPTRKVAKGRTLSLAACAQRIASQCLIATVTLSTDVPVYPKQIGERIIFPTGTFTTTLSTPEIRFALDHGHLRSIGAWAAYEAAPLFRSYVETLYALRLEYARTGNTAFAYLCKLLLNSLYGKFGQRGMRWEWCPESWPDDQTEWIGNCTAEAPALHHRRRFGQVQHQVIGGESSESFPAIAAHVTAYGRMYLWVLREQAGRQHVYYCDTDSLWVDALGARALDRYLDHTRLGALKVERLVHHAHFRAPKDYQLGSFERVKGVRKQAVKLSANTYLQPQFESYDQALARGVDGEILVRFITKTVSRRNHQSRGEGVGWRLPLVLDEP